MPVQVEGVLQGKVSGNERGRRSDLRPAPPHQPRTLVQYQQGAIGRLALNGTSVIGGEPLAGARVERTFRYAVRRAG